MRPRLFRTIQLSCTLILPFVLQAADPIAYSKDVLPILKQSCYERHGIDNPMAKLDLRIRAGMLKGGGHGPARGPAPTGKGTPLRTHPRVVRGPRISIRGRESRVGRLG